MNGSGNGNGKENGYGKRVKVESEVARKKIKTEGEKKRRVKREQKEEEEAEEYEWWRDQNGDKDDTIRWTQLEHQGVLFPPEYVPHGVPILYDGEKVYLEPEIEELVGFFAALLETEHGANPTFQRNFFNELKLLMSKSKRKYPIKEFSRCDFRPMYEYFQKQKEEKKQMSKEEKAALLEERKMIEEKYGYCILDGRREKVGNFRIEPPGLFRGRGAHPKTGCYKRRVRAEQITINIGKDAKIPEPPKGSKWGNVIHDQTVTWLAMWKENVNDNTKYVFLAAGSSLKGQSDLKKYEKARELKKHIVRIRKDYMAALTSSDGKTRQRATALYLIDRFALRAGNEKGDDQADTVGCCSLRYEHVTFEDGKVVFDFLGKDSIRYYNKVEVHPAVYRNLVSFQRAAKTPGNLLFSLINTVELNKHLSSLMPGLSAKVFRTYNASHTFQQELEKQDVTPASSIHELTLAYNRANRQVAVLCNHQRAVAKNFSGQLSKIADRLMGLRYECRRHIDLLKPNLTDLSLADRAKYDLAPFEQACRDDPDRPITTEWLYSYFADLLTKDIERLEKKKASDATQSNLDSIEEKLASLSSELSTLNSKKEALSSSKSSKPYIPEMYRLTFNSIDKSFSTIQRLYTRIVATKTALVDKDENKTTALGTSKINYIDPRITVSWCKKFDIPVEKFFPKTLREKFKWAMHADKNFKF
ncbi:DNA topoisomerase 1 [Zancudomyces culisetae]|uniref:DNA topoisomerase I n=1 Tax=Zancudomyces culisetae TaxID=1213189 RepID=A0A1R1PDA9_ZANCU|nr:DNA topoisomerase 1 [Zancudomyces culisetae]OMH80509.1 DNA topoisomerase 1 [Zancudomyces culisetae]|eukprot:OMH78957.1 DNA topoisomerase 1 [Zancudomyces culisetae]